MKRLTTEQFIEQAKAVHGDLYDYSLVEYISTKQPVKIACKEHGVFEQTPNSHLAKKAGCPDCSRCPPFTSEKFVERAKAIHDDKYDYSLVAAIGGMKINDQVDVICPQHGIFKTTARKHINSEVGCAHCAKDKAKEAADSKRKTLEQFVADAKNVHGDQYQYHLAKYINTHFEVEIMCPKHGSFLQTPNRHLSQKQGCPECHNEARFGRPGGLSLKNMDVPGYLYLIRFQKEGSSFLKVGIAMHGVKQRWGLTHRGYTITTLIEEPILINKGYDIEQFVMMECNGIQQYVDPELIHGGSTECFIDTPENEELLIDTIRILLEG